MPEQPFTVHVDLDALALPAAPVLPPALDGDAPDRPAKRHHHHDDQAESRRRSAHSQRAAGLGKGRSYAFRRS